MHETGKVWNTCTFGSGHIGHTAVKAFSRGTNDCIMDRIQATLGIPRGKTNVAYVHVGSSRCLLVFVKDVLAPTWTLWVINWTDNFFDLLDRSTILASSGRKRSSLIQGRCSGHVLEIVIGHCTFASWPRQE